jgi:hypothetical protein
MTTLHVPSPADATTLVCDCIDVLPLGPVTEERRQQLIKNCHGPFVLLIEAVLLAGTAGPDEEAVLIQGIRQLFAQAEYAKRQSYLSNLLVKLSAQRDNE